MESKYILLLLTSLLVLTGLSTQVYLSSSLPTFDPQEAIGDYYYAKASFCEIDQIQSWTCPSCLKHKNVQEVQVFNSPVIQIQGYCGYDLDTDTIIVAYRGTSNTPNEIADVVYTLVDYPACQGCKVHVGFKTALEGTSYVVNPCVKSLLKKHPTASALVTGHSLGGALATLSVLEVAKIVNPSKVKYISFGAPRVGNEQFADHFNSVVQKGQRIVNFRDVYPHVPLQSMGFKQVNYEIWMLFDGAVNNFKVCPLDEDPSCSNSLKYYNTEQHWTYFGIEARC